jgi:hypothetical protein
MIRDNIAITLMRSEVVNFFVAGIVHRGQALTDWSRKAILTSMTMLTTARFTDWSADMALFSVYILEQQLVFLAHRFFKGVNTAQAFVIVLQLGRYVCTHFSFDSINIIGMNPQNYMHMNTATSL